MATRILMENGFYLEKDAPGYYYYNDLICNRIDRSTKLAGPAAEMVTRAMDELDKETSRRAAR